MEATIPPHSPWPSTIVDTLAPPPSSTTSTPSTSTSISPSRPPTSDPTQRLPTNEPSISPTPNILVSSTSMPTAIDISKTATSTIIDDSPLPPEPKTADSVSFTTLELAMMSLVVVLLCIIVSGIIWYWRKHKRNESEDNETKGKNMVTMLSLNTQSGSVNEVDVDGILVVDEGGGATVLTILDGHGESGGIVTSTELVEVITAYNYKVQKTQPVTC